MSETETTSALESAGLVPIIARTSPFRRPETRTAREGLTITKMIREAGIDPIYWKYLAVSIDGALVDPWYFDFVRPKAGHHVTITMVPRGGDDGEGGGKGRHRRRADRRWRGP